MNNTPAAKMNPNIKYIIVCFITFILYGFSDSIASSKISTLFMLYNSLISSVKYSAVTLAIFFASIAFLSLTVIFIISVSFTDDTDILLYKLSYVISKSNSSITFVNTLLDLTISAYVSTNTLFKFTSAWLIALDDSLLLRITVVYDSYIGV